MLSSACDVEEIGDGNLNDVWRIRSRDSPDKTVIVKHSPPYVKVKVILLGLQVLQKSIIVQ